MITSEQASQLIQSTVRDFGSERVRLSEAFGRVLNEAVISDRPFPPFDRICMDGIAIDHQAFQNGQKVFEVQGIQSAGSPPLTLASPSYAVEVMTGAMMPQGATTVIRYEDLQRQEDGSFEVLIDAKDKANIHYTGEDLAESSFLIKQGTRIRSAEIALCATVGLDEVEVKSLPKVAILSSGDELVEISTTPKPYQIRRSNSHMLQAELKGYGVDAQVMHVDDDPKKIEATLKDIFSRFDVLLMSGGVSKGKYDHMPDVLEALGADKLFHRVQQRPGKPFWFGKTDTTVVFAFPGNPVSALVGCIKYFKPWLESCLGTSSQLPYVTLASDFEFKPNLTYFAQAKLHSTNGGWTAEVIKGNGSGDMVSLAHVDGFVELPAGKTLFKAGEVYPFLSM